MIKLKCINTETFHDFEITKFPDGTSQVWKIQPPPRIESWFKVIWRFESEAEVSHLIQLGSLLRMVCEKHKPILFMPFLPFGRQDKSIDNHRTFAKHPIFQTLQQFFTLITYDAHSDFTDDEHGEYSITNLSPEKFHGYCLNSLMGYDMVCFPDRGAKDRYMKTLPVLEIPVISLRKDRDEETGEIKGLFAPNIPNHSVSKVLIIDDICDGGRTFIECVKVLKEKYEADTIDLAVTHGIFSKGRQVLHDAGIRTIFTTNSLPQNADGYNILF